jgi:hypothetical protein
MGTKEVINDKGEVFTSISEAARYYGITKGSIFNCLAGKTIKAHKLKWKYND